LAYNGETTYPPLSLGDGCFSTWQEIQQDNVVRNTMDKGNVRVRRRFTGIAKSVQATVRLSADKYLDFMGWFNDGQKQGTIPTTLKTPYGREELFLWTSPPTINWISAEVFEASVTMYQGSNWNDY
jgi:hypothetical protein